jgi:hypothetical protein
MVFIDLENVDVKKLEDGYFVGSISIAPSKGLLEEIAYYADVDFSMIGVAVSGMALRVDVAKNNGKDIDMTVSLMSGSDPYISVSMKNKITDGSTVKEPKKTVDDPDAWIMEFDTEEFKKRVEKSDLPEYITEYIEMFEGLLADAS